MFEIKEGQIWSYKKRKLDKDSYIVVRRFSKNKENLIVHISIMNIHVGTEIWYICHVPISYEILMSELTMKTKDNYFIDFEEFEEAYDVWKTDNGGYWSIPLKEIIEKTLETICGNASEMLI